MAKLDQWIGSPVAKRIPSWGKWWFEKFGSMHKIGLFEPEEDEFILLHIFSTIFLIAPFPFEDELRPFMMFDEALSPARRARIMAFYKKCVQRHLFTFGSGRRFLSKNPMFSPKIQSLGETFPDAKIICTTRTPFEVLPSEISIFSQFYNSFGSPLEKYPMREAIYNAIAHWYRYPVDKLEKWDPKRKAILKYTNLVQDPEQTVLNLYERFGFNMHPRFRQVLQEEAEKARQYKSQHVYSLEQTGLTREKVVSDYKDIFERFGFDTMEGDATRNF
jgi:hypothetical protein